MAAYVLMVLHRQPRLQGRTIELMVCSSDRTLGLLNLAV